MSNLDKIIIKYILLYKNQNIDILYLCKIYKK